MEIELKLLVEPADIDALMAHPALQRHAMEKPHRRTLVSTYFDTPDLRLRRAAASVRVRQTGQGWVQTLKGGGSSQGGLHQRNEWEQEVAGPALDVASLRKIIDPDCAWHGMLGDDKLMAALTPIFTTRFTRQIWNLLLPDGTQVECALDTGTVETEKGSLPLSELELELKSGATDALFEFALTLLDSVPLRIGHASKAERGYALHQQTDYQPVKAEIIALSGDATVERGFEAVVNSALRQLFANEDGLTHAAHHMESIHQMRVGLRRLSTGFRLFEDRIRIPDDLHAEFRWLADQLGQARDWQVLATSTLTDVAHGASGTIALRDLVAAVERKAEQGQAVAAAAAGSVRHTRLMLDFMRWMTGRHWRQTPANGRSDRALSTPLKKFANRILEKTQRKLLRRGRQVTDADAHSLHRVRIAAKRVRYAAEFFQSLYPPKRTRRLIRRCADLQDMLGKMNDMAVGQRLLAQLDDPNDPKVRASVAFAQGYFAAKTENPGRLPDKPWKRIRKAVPVR